MNTQAEIVKKMPSISMPFPVALNLCGWILGSLNTAITRVATNHSQLDKEELLLLKNMVADAAEMAKILSHTFHHHIDEEEKTSKFAQEFDGLIQYANKLNNLYEEFFHI